MAQDPGTGTDEQSPEDVNLSHDLDMVALYDSQDVDAEMDADNIRGVLQSNGIESLIQSTPYANVLGVKVLVARNDLERAKALVAEALAAGPQAAAEAEADSEKQ